MDFASDDPNSSFFCTCHVSLWIRAHAPGVPSYKLIRKTRSQGDLTNDGTVDFRDFRAWKIAHEGAGSGVSFGSAVPEPTSAALALISMSVFFITRRRRQHVVTVS